MNPRGSTGTVTNDGLQPFEVEQRCQCENGQVIIVPGSACLNPNTCPIGPNADCPSACCFGQSLPSNPPPNPPRGEDGTNGQNNSGTGDGDGDPLGGSCPFGPLPAPNPSQECGERCDGCNQAHCNFNSQTPIDLGYTCCCEGYTCRDHVCVPSLSPSDPNPPPSSPTNQPTERPTLAPINSDIHVASRPNRTSNLMAYLANWRRCPDASDLRSYTHVIIGFAVTYMYRPGGNLCSEDCSLNTVFNPVDKTNRVPVCNNAANNALLNQLRAQGTKVRSLSSAFNS